MKPNFTPYPDGLYRSADGAEYKLSQGPAALSVSGPAKLCMMFWDQEHAPRDRKVIELNGQKCGAGFGTLDWTARYSVDRMGEVRLTSRSAPPIVLTRLEER